MAVVSAQSLHKTFQVSRRPPGLWASVKHFVHRQCEDVHAVRDVSFSVERGEFVGVLGSNGAGKTTTLKMLAGLLRPTSGGCEVLGVDPFRRRRDHLKRISLVMGNRQQLIWDLPALDSYRIHAALYDIDDGDARQRVGALREMLGLDDDILQQPVRKLSLGQRMKAELVAALLHQPEVIFLDEPTLGLDVAVQHALRDFLKAYNQETQATVLLTSHYMADVVELCPRILLFQDGGMTYDGSLQSFLEEKAPHRLVEAHFDHDVDDVDLQRIAPFARTERGVVFEVARSDVAEVTAEVLRSLRPQDLSVRDVDVDDIVRGAFQASAEGAA
mgnify:CR=1 FL=1